MISRDNDSYREPPSNDESEDLNRDARNEEESSDARPMREDGSLGRKSTTQDAETDPSLWSSPPDKPDPGEGPADSRASRFHTAEDPDAEAAPRTTEGEEDR
jgi:hypothetical protein